MTKVDSFSDQEFIDIINTSYSYREVSIRLGYSKNTSIKDKIQKRCNKLQISFEHLDEHQQINRELNPDIVFVENSTVSQNSLRRWYIKGKYSEYKCSICGQEPFWNGKELTLTLDHINGNNRDNRLDNLRWVCPNCDRQLPTFGSKNIKNVKEKVIIKNFCMDCGVEISETAIRCNKCNGIFARKINRPNKEELLNILIENNGNFTKVGKIYNMSDNGIRKWCKNYNLSTYSKDYKK